MAKQQQPGQSLFPVAAGGSSLDHDMGSTAAASSGGGDGKRDDMSELEQALGLAAAWFGGDVDVAAWAAADDDADPPAPAADWLPGGDDLAGQQQQQWGDWKDDDEGALELPPEQQQQQQQLPGLEFEAGLGDSPDDIGTLGSSSSLLLEEPAADSSLAGSSLQPNPAETLPEAAGSADAGSSGSGAAAAGAAAAADVAHDMQHMHLDDIDAELADTVAPGEGPLSIEEALAQAQGAAGGGQAAAAADPPPPLIVPAPTDLAAVEEDPLGALEAAIQADKPKFVPSPEWLKMMEAVQGELEEAAGKPELVPEGAGHAGAEPAASVAERVPAGGAAEAQPPPGSQAADADMAEPQQQQEEQQQQEAEEQQQQQQHEAQGASGAAHRQEQGQMPGQQQQEAARILSEAERAAEAGAVADPSADAAPPVESPPLAPAAPAAAPQQESPASSSLDRERQRTFVRLQPICSLLLLQRADPQRMAEQLTALEAALRESSPLGLQQCLDYAMFPLLMMMDAMAATRQPKQAGHQQQQQQAAAGAAAEAGVLLTLPAMAADRAAEAALACLLTLLRRCSCQAGEGLLGLLHRLASILALPAGSASEEMRQQALLCLGAAAAGVVDRRAPPGVREALLSEAAAPQLGYLSSLLLQTAEAEAQGGSSGSKGLRDAALHALQQLLTAVAGPVAAVAGASSEGAVNPDEAQRVADALAYFLPGVAVGLCKALLLAAASSGGGGSKALAGPAGSSAAAVAAVESLVLLLTACLGDAAVQAALHGSAADAHRTAAGGGGGTSSGSGWHGADADMADADVAADGRTSSSGRDSIQDALQQLKLLSQRAKGGSGKPAAADAAAAASAAAAPPRPQQQQRREGPLRVDRSAEWVASSAEQLHQLLATAVPPLLAHQRPAVREALVKGCCRLLDGCSMALQQPTQEELLQLLLSAAQDEWQQVATPARAWLGQQAAASAAAAAAGAPAAAAEMLGPRALPAAAAAAAAATAFAAVSERLLLQLVEGLPEALRTGDAVGRRHAQQLTSALQVCPPAWFAANLVHHPLRLQQLLSCFLEAYAFDASIAAMLLYSAAPPSGSATSYAPAAAQPAAAGQGSAGSIGDVQPASAAQEAEAASGGAPQQQPAAQGQLAVAGGGVVMLPRMPPGLTLITTTSTYEAVAAALRAAAALAAAADAAPGSSGTALRCLIDGFLGKLQQLTEAAVGASAAAAGGQNGARHAHKRSRRQGAAGGGGSDPQQHQPDPAAAAGQAPWQLQAASVAAVLAELLLGASPAWQPSWRLAGVPEPGLAAGSSGGSSRELESLAAAVVQDLVQDAIWVLPTATPADYDSPAAPDGSSALPLLDAAAAIATDTAASSGSSYQQQRLTVQQLGCNALLLKAAIECCGTAARALGPRFAHNGRLLRTALLPLLEKLADGSQMVASAARAAVGSVCCWCGYGGSLQRLVAANADYVVDGMCRQLRQLDTHPRAPQLFTALLQQAGVAPQLLPVLAEPARTAVQGLGILARRQQPKHVLAFLQTLLPVAAAAGAVARQALAEMRQVADEVQERWDERQRQMEEEEQQRQGAAAAASDIGGDGDDIGAAAAQAKVRRYFQQRQQRKEQQQAEGEGHPVEAMEQEEEEQRVVMSSSERERVSLLRRHIHAAAGLAQAVADAVSPLQMSQSLQVAVQSFGVCVAALRALAAATEAVELDTSKIQMLARKRTDIAAPDPDTPRLLPSVHLAWAPLMGALQDWRVSVIESAVQFLADTACLAGSFVRKRFAQDALPLLQQLLRNGPARRNIIAPGQDDVTSPAAVQRVQLAVLRCLHQVAGCDTYLSIAGISSSASDALLPAVQLLLYGVGDIMGRRHSAPVRELATQTYVALAKIDPDAAWCQLHAVQLAATGGTPSAVAFDSTHEDTTGQPPRLPPGLHLSGSSQRLAFPADHESLLPVSGLPATASPSRTMAKAATPSAASSPQGLRECSSAKLAAMMRQIEQFPARWHKQVEALLRRH